MMMLAKQSCRLVARQSVFAGVLRSSVASRSFSSIMSLPDFYNLPQIAREVNLSAGNQKSPPIPLEPGETLLYTSISHLKTQYFTRWLGSAILSTYLAVVKIPDILTDGTPMLSPGVTSMFTFFTIASFIFCKTTTSRFIKYAVLSADGTKLKLYPMSKMGIGHRKPVTIPISLFSLYLKNTREKRDFHTISARVAHSGSALYFEKPMYLGIQYATGTGLSPLFYPTQNHQEIDNPNALPRESVNALNISRVHNPDVLAGLRRYAVLLNALEGHPYRLPFSPNDTDMSLPEFIEALISSRRSNEGEWVPVKTENGTYYYNERTWSTSWSVPNHVIESEMLGEKLRFKEIVNPETGEKTVLKFASPLLEELSNSSKISTPDGVVINGETPKTQVKLPGQVDLAKLKKKATRGRS